MTNREERPAPGPLSPLGERMRIRATVAAVSGALVLSAFAVSAAHADDSAAYRADVTKVQAAPHAAAGKTAFSSNTAADVTGTPYAMNVTFSNVKIASAVKVGTTNHVATTVT